MVLYDRMAMASDGEYRETLKKANVKIRKAFPESWIYKDIDDIGLVGQARTILKLTFAALSFLIFVHIHSIF